MQRCIVRSLTLAVTCLLFVAPAVAQVTTATLYGTVRDSSGSVLPGATVTVTHEGTGTTRTTATSAAGEFALTALPLGPYTVKVELQGFKTHLQRGLALGSGQTARQSFELEIGTLAESVMVEGVTPPFFGQIRGAGSPRTIQLGARLTF